MRRHIYEQQSVINDGELGETIYYIIEDIVRKALKQRTPVGADGILVDVVKVDTGLLNDFKQLIKLKNIDDTVLEFKPKDWLYETIVVTLNKDNSISIHYDAINEIYGEIRRFSVAKSRWIFNCVIEKNGKCKLEIDTQTPVDLTLDGSLFTRAARY